MLSKMNTFFYLDRTYKISIVIETVFSGKSCLLRRTFGEKVKLVGDDVE